MKNETEWMYIGAAVLGYAYKHVDWETLEIQWLRPNAREFRYTVIGREMPMLDFLAEVQDSKLTEKVKDLECLVIGKQTYGATYVPAKNTVVISKWSDI